MTKKRRISYWRKLRNWPVVIGASAALAAGATVAIGGPPRPCADCRYTVDGVCIPNATTYGYYQTQWRTWPKPLAVSTAAPRTDTKLPTQVEPPPAQEDLDNAPRPPASSGDMGGTPPVKPATGDEQIPPKTDKPDPFQDDPVQNGESTDRSDARGETSILVPPIAEPIESYGLVDEVPALPRAVQSRYDEEPHLRSPVAPASDEQTLRLVESNARTEPKSLSRAPAQAATPEGVNPLRGGWGARGESPLREPKVVTQFGGAAPTNPLRR